MKAAIMAIPQDRLAEVLSGRSRIKNMPPDARIASTWLDCDRTGGDPRNLRLFIRIEHPSLREVSAGCRFPRRPAIFEPARNPAQRKPVATEGRNASESRRSA